MKKKVFSVLMAVVMLVVVHPAMQISVNAADGDEYAMFVFNQLHISRTNAHLDPDQRGNSPNPAVSGHGLGGMAFDLIGNDLNVKAPFTGKIYSVDYGGAHGVIFQSLYRVRFANGELDYMTILLVHDDYVSDLWSGQIINQGIIFYQQGTYGDGKTGTYGRHLHIEAARGLRTNISAIRANKIQLNDALFLKKDTNRTKDYISVSAGNGGGTISLNWRIVPDVVHTPPNPPTSVTLSASGIPNVAVGTSITASWSGASGSIANYRAVLIRTNNNAVIETKMTGTNTSTAFTLKSAGTYKVSITAVGPTNLESGVKDSSNVVTAHDPVTVTYKDWDDTVLKIAKVDYGKDGTPPSVPERTGYTFTGFSPRNADIRVTQDQTLKADYEKKTYTVRFFDINDNQIGSTQLIKYEESAVPPSAPVVPGYLFIDWNSCEYEMVTRDLTIYAAYKWANYDIPLTTQVLSAIRAPDQKSYSVSARLTNHIENTVRGRVIVTLKTSDGKMVSSAIEEFALDGTNSVTRNIQINTDSLATVAEVSVVGVSSEGNTGAPLSDIAITTIDLGTLWSEWSVNPPPANADFVETGMQYSYRDKYTTTGSSSTMAGWTWVRQTSAWGAYGAWSAWSTAQVYQSDSRNIETRSAYVKTQWRYGHYKNWSNGNTSPYWYSGFNGTWHSTGWLDYRVAQNGYSSAGPAKYGPAWCPVCGSSSHYLYAEESQDDTRTEWRYQDRSLVYTHYFERYEEVTLPVGQSVPEKPANVAERTVTSQKILYRFRNNDIEKTAYHYKRYKYQSLSNGIFYFAYDPTYSDSMGYPGEWEYNKSYSELAVVATVDGNIALYNGYGEDSWYRADINNLGNKTEYEVIERMDVSDATPRHIEGTLNAPAGKKITLLVFHGSNIDPTANQLEYVDQTTLGENGAYSFDFKTRKEPGEEKTGDYIIMIAVEGQLKPIYIDTIKAPRPTYTVTFIDEDGSVIDQQTVLEWESADLPPNPEKEGHWFIGWDTSTANIRADITITARYEKKEYTVVFINWDDEEFTMQTYQHGDPITTENIPMQFGGVFTGWGTPDGKIVSMVTDNMVLTAMFSVAEYSVDFFNPDGSILETQIVAFGGKTSAPSVASTYDGLVFRYWSEETSCVFQDMEIFPVYGYPQTAVTPVSSVDSGSYAGLQTVSLASETSDAQIFYSVIPIDVENEVLFTDDPFVYGEDGTIINGTLYTEPIEITSDTLLAYISVAEGMNNSEIGVSAYFLSSGEPSAPFSVNVESALDSNTKFNSLPTLVTKFQLRANEDELVIQNTQGLRLAYDTSVLQLIRWNATSATNEPVGGNPFAAATGAGNIGVLGDSMTVFNATNLLGDTGYLSMSISAPFDTYECQQGSFVTLGEVRFAFRPGKTAADLDDDSIRIMDTDELAALNQSYAVIINDVQGNIYTYGRQEDGIALPLMDALEKPLIIWYVDPGVFVTGKVKTYNPKAPTTIQLMQGDDEMYKTTIEATTGSGQIEQTFTFASVMPGTYTLVISKPAHTSFTVQTVVVENENVDLTQDARPDVKLMTLRCGDINGDRMINDGDLTVLWMTANYNRNVSTAANPLCDLNGDGMINDGDLTILWMVANYNRGRIIIP